MALASLVMKFLMSSLMVQDEDFSRRVDFRPKVLKISTVTRAQP